MSEPAQCQIIGRWRILESDQWDRDYLDLIDPAFIAFATDGHGELAFGVVTVSLRPASARAISPLPSRSSGLSPNCAAIVPSRLVQPRRRGRREL